MSGDNIEKLYQNYGILADAKDDISQVRFLTYTFIIFICVAFFTISVLIAVLMTISA